MESPWLKTMGRMQYRLQGMVPFRIDRGGFYIGSTQYCLIGIDDPEYAISVLLYPVGIIMRPEQNELDGFVRCFPAIRAGHNDIVAFFPAHFAIEIDDDEIALHRT